MADQTDNDGKPQQAPEPVVVPEPQPIASEPVAAAVPAPPVATKPVAAPVATKVAAAPVAKPATRKAAVRAKPARVKKPAVVVKKAKARPASKPAALTPKLSVTELKDKIMASKTTDFTATINKSMTEAVSDMQSKAQAAYDKGTGLVAEMTELAKGNVEAVVESGKILASGLEGLGKTYAEEAKSAYEVLTADIKEMAAIKSPTDLFQLQGKIMRRNFDAMVATSSKGGESAMKLATETFAPITARVNLAVAKLSQAA